MTDLAQERPPTRDRIVAAAERLFAGQGFDRVSMPEIARESGITAGAIYKHFASKDDLFFEVVRRAVEAAPLPPGAGGIAELPGLVGGFAAPELKPVRQLAVEIHHASSQHPRIAELLRASLTHNIAELRDAIVAGAGEAATDAGMTAHAVMVFIVGLMHMESLAPDLVGDPAWRRTIERSVAALLHAPVP